MSDADPLILTLAFDDACFAYFDALRRRHFPAERNFIPAHLTLFHNLPGARGTAIEARLRAVAGETPPLALCVAGLRFLGRGVAFAIESEALAALRGRLAGEWADILTLQDRQNFRPHVTIQNKVLPQAARALHEALAPDFKPFMVEGTGLLLWRYRGGPWETAGTFPFARALSQQRCSAEPSCE